MKENRLVGSSCVVCLLAEKALLGICPGFTFADLIFNIDCSLPFFFLKKLKGVWWLMGFLDSLLKHTGSISNHSEGGLLFFFTAELCVLMKN